MAHSQNDFSRELQAFMFDVEEAIETDHESVQIPDTPSPLTAKQNDELKMAINPLGECKDLGVSLYVLARAFVNACTCT